MIRIPVDLTNPGQFFGCCGVFELAHRRWPGALAGFVGADFVVTEGDLDQLLKEVAATAIEVLEPSNEKSSALRLGGSFGLRLDWWKTERGLKTWAGQMSVDRIARGLQQDLLPTLERGFFDDGHVVVGADGTKVEPYYFDSRRGAGALPLDLGFSTDKLGMKTVAYCATEFFTLIGLQRFRPSESKPRVYRYRAWRRMLPATLAALAAGDVIPEAGTLFRFESAFRTDHRDLKGFIPALPVNGDRHE